MILRCAECEAETEHATRGWLGVRAQVPGEDEQPLVVIYCPECAERECGGRPGNDRPAEPDA